MCFVPPGWKYCSQISSENWRRFVGWRNRSNHTSQAMLTCFRLLRVLFLFLIVSRPWFRCRITPHWREWRDNCDAVACRCKKVTSTGPCHWHRLDHWYMDINNAAGMPRIVSRDRRRSLTITIKISSESSNSIKSSKTGWQEDHKNKRVPLAIFHFPTPLVTTVTTPKTVQYYEPRKDGLE